MGTIRDPLPRWPYPDRPNAGSFIGAEHGSGISFFVVDAAPGGGPRLHTHPYSETFILLAGRARFRLGDESIEARAGDVVVAPAGVPHKFEALEQLRSVNVHAAPRTETAWLEQDEPAS
jgi:quercetin dioxygenase-like cupin family protein